MEYGVYDVLLCICNTGQSPGLQGWLIHALSIAVNQTSDSTAANKLFGV